MPDDISGLLRWRWLVLVLFCGAALALYLPAIGGEFLWDDQPYYLNNQFIVGENGLYRIWLTREPVDYWPLMYTTFWLEYRLWGPIPIPAHIINILIHAATAMVLWRCLARLEVPGAFLAALLFLVHPVNVDAVAIVFQRKTVMAGFFFFLALYFFVRFDRKPDARWMIAALVAFAAALLSKTSAVMLPPTLLVLIWWRQGGVVTRHDLMRVAPFFLMALALGGLGYFYQKASMTELDPVLGSLVERVVFAGRAFWFYLGQVFYPFDLSFIYNKWEIDADDWRSYIGTAWVVFSGLSLWWLRRRDWARAMLVMLALFAINLFPALGFIEIVYFGLSPAADRFQYIAIAAPLALIAGFIAQNYRMRQERHGTKLLAAAGVIVLVLGGLTRTQAETFQSKEALWLSVQNRQPNNPLTFAHLAAVRIEQERIRDAMLFMEKALQLSPKSPQVQFQMGNLLSHIGDLTRAETHFQKALELVPDFQLARLGLATLQIRQGRLRRAEQTLKDALARNPNSYIAHTNLAVLYSQRGDDSEAERLLLRALLLHPKSPEVRQNLGALYLRSGRHLEALAQALLARKWKPDDPKILYLTARAHIGAGNKKAARAALEETLRLDPKAGSAAADLAWLLATSIESGDALIARAIALGKTGAANGGTAGLDALAAAYARAGRFDDALRTIDRAIGGALVGGEAGRLRGLRYRRGLYVDGQVYTE